MKISWLRKLIGVALAAALSLTPALPALAAAEGAAPAPAPAGALESDTQEETEARSEARGNPESRAYEDLGIIIRYRPEVSAQRRAALTQSLGQAVASAVRPDVELLRPAPGITQEQAIEALQGARDVLYVEPNYPVQATAFPADPPNDPLYTEQWGLGAYTSAFGIDAGAAWAGLADQSLATAVVAVLDTGVDPEHPDLANRLYRDAQGEVIGATFVPYSTSFNDDNGHGTHVAGIVAAQANNGVGVAGIAGLADAGGNPAVAVMPVKVLDHWGAGSTYAVAQGIYWAADHGADVINLSLSGANYSVTLADAVRYAQDRGVVVVAAAGNAGGPTSNVYPAAFFGVLTVAATDSWGDVALFSNYGPEVDVAAPGVNVLSTYPEELDVPDGNDSTQDGYRYLSGTSMATPFVAGLVGLLKAVDPALTASAIMEIITASANDLNCTYCSPGRDDASGHGLINAYQALMYGGMIPALRWENPEPGVNIVSTTTLTVSVSAPEKVGAVEFYLDEETAPLGSVSNDDSNPHLYSLEWSPIAQGVAEGPHNLKAVVKDKAGAEVGSALQEITVAPTTTGLTLHIIAPNGRSAGGAVVNLFRVEQYGEVREYEWQWSGTTDPEGDLRISDWSSIYTGLEYLVTVNGVVPPEAGTSAPSQGELSWFYYSQTFDTADPNQRGFQTIDTRDALKITPVLMEGGQPVNLGAGTIHVYPGDLLAHSYGSGVALGAWWESGDGPSSFWVKPGYYDLVLAGAGSTAAYYLRLKNQDLSAPLVLPFDADLAAPVKIQAPLPEGSTAQFAGLVTEIGPWDEPMRLGPADLMAENGEVHLPLYSGDLKISQGDYRMAYRSLFAEPLTAGGTRMWTYEWLNWDPLFNYETGATIPPEGLTITLGQGVFAQMEDEFVSPYPGGFFGAELRVYDDQQHLLTHVTASDRGILKPEGLRLRDESNNVVDSAFDPGNTVLEYGPEEQYVQAEFAATAPTSGIHTAEVDLPVGPLESTGLVTAVSRPFTMEPAPVAPGSYPLDLYVHSPEGTTWSGDVIVSLYEYDEFLGGHWPRYRDAAYVVNSNVIRFTPSSINLDETGSYYVVAYGQTNTGAAVVYSQPISPAPSVSLEPAALLPVWVRALDQSGDDYAGDAHLTLSNANDRSLPAVPLTISFTDGAENLYITDATYDALLTGWVGYPLEYTFMGASNDWWSGTGELVFDFTSAPGIQLTPQQALDMDLIAMPEGMDLGFGWDDSAIASVPTYFTPGRYRMYIMYAADSAPGVLAEGVWEFELLPAETGTDGYVTLNQGDGVRTWSAGGAIRGTVNIGEGITRFFPNDTLPVSAQFSDAHGNPVLLVEAYEGWDIWYDQVEPVVEPAAGQQVSTTAVAVGEGPGGSEAGAGLEAALQGEGAVESQDYYMPQQRPVFVVTGRNGEVYRTQSDTYLFDFYWTLPESMPAGEYTAQYLLQVDSETVVSQSRTFSVSPMVTIDGSHLPASLGGGQDLVVQGEARRIPGMVDTLEVFVSDGNTTLTKQVEIGPDNGTGLGAYSATFTATELENLTDSTLEVTAEVWVDFYSYSATEYVVKATAPGSISGQVLLPARSGTEMGGVSVKVVGHPIAAVTNPDGTFSLDGVPAGTHQVLVRAPGHLAALVSGVTVYGQEDTPLAPVGLQGGDASGDNVVGLIDLAILARSYGLDFGAAGYDSRADFNADGRVSLADLVVLANSYGWSGDPIPAGE